MTTECMTMSVIEAARRAGIGRNSAYEAIKRGELPAIRIGGKIRVPRAALERRLNGERSTSEAA